MLRPVAYALVALTTALALGACDKDFDGFGGDQELGPKQDPSISRTDAPAPAGTGTDLMGEPCEEPEAVNACDDGEGVQYCGGYGMELEWGPCLTDAECRPGDYSDCGVRSGCQNFGSGQCVIWGGVPEFDCNEVCGDTPLVFSFDDRPVRYSAASVDTFDIAGAGECITTDWPTAATPWLARDLNGDGQIVDGAELFGSGTHTRAGHRADNGFSALAELDHDGDGLITPADPGFAELVLWSDHDGDRRSSAFELTPLAEHGVTAVELSYTNDARCDARGNCELERADFWFASRAGEVQRGAVVDVHLPCQ